MTREDALDLAVQRVGQRYYLPTVQLNPARFPNFIREVRAEMQKILSLKTEVEIAPRTGQILKHDLLNR